MPLYEFQCLDCGQRFEVLIRHSDCPRCPNCEGRKLEQLISNFSVSSEGTRQTNLASARRENAPTLRDKAIAEAEVIRNHKEE